MRDLKFICCQPDDDYYLWQVHLWVQSLKEIGQSENAVILVYTPNYREFNKKWEELSSYYPESEFKFYKDDENGVSRLLGIYIPVLRPFMLRKYFLETPGIDKCNIFYSDCDVLFTKQFNISDYLENDRCYVSNTISYINSDYIDGKIKDVLPEKLEEYKKRDILGELTAISGVTREIAEKNKDHSGGAQYLLKDIDYLFWEKVIGDCIRIRIFLQTINKQYFENENKGFQSWCADMWAVLYNLWRVGKEVEVIKEMDFAWSGNNISKLEECTLLHNAGINGPLLHNTPVFYKGTYYQGKSPFKDVHIETILNNEDSKKLCSYYYTKKLSEIKETHKIKYSS